MPEPPADPLTELHRLNAELVAARRAAVDVMEDAILVRDALRASEERQAFLLKLSDALRPLTDPMEVQAVAARMLGEHLGVDRAYYVELHEAKGEAFVYRDYLRGGSPSLVGRHRIADFGWVIPPMRRGEVLVIPDVPACPLVPAADQPAMAATRIAAHVNAPLVKAGTLVGALCVTEPGPRAWTPAETELVRETGDRIWAAVERAKAEAALRESEGRFRALADSAPVLMWLNDTTGCVFVNRAYLDYLGLGRQTDVRGYEWSAYVHPDDREAYLAGYRTAVERRGAFEAEFRFLRHDGVYRWMRSVAVPRITTAGEYLGYTGCTFDVHEPRLAGLAVRAGEERLRLIVESATDYAIFTLAPDGTVTSWNPGAADLFLYHSDEIIGQPADVLFTPEDRAAGAPAQEIETARATGRASDERWHLRKDGTRFYASGVLSLLRDGGGFVKVARDLTDRKLAEEQLERRVVERTAELAAAVDALETEMDRRRELARRLVTTQEDERRRVARDLHDTLGQLQAGLGMAVAAARRAPLSAAADERLAEVQRLLDELTRETHSLAVRLRPTALDDLGLEPALRQLVSDWFAQTGLNVDFQPTGLTRDRLPVEMETAIYRMVQEALTNVTRHASATRVGVAVVRTDGEVTATVEDDGVGFDPAAAAAGRLGLVGMRERVELAGGTLELESESGTGTTVLARFPLTG